MAVGSCRRRSRFRLSPSTLLSALEMRPSYCATASERLSNPNPAAQPPTLISAIHLPQTALCTPYVLIPEWLLEGFRVSGQRVFCAYSRSVLHRRADHPFPRAFHSFPHVVLPTTGASVLNVSLALDRTKQTPCLRVGRYRLLGVAYVGCFFQRRCWNEALGFE